MMILFCYTSFGQMIDRPFMTFFNSICYSPQFSTNEDRIVDRIIDIAVENKILSIQLEAMIMCSYGEVGRIKFLNDTLFLYTTREKEFDIDKTGDTLYFESEVSCYCDYILSFDIANINTLPKTIYFNNKQITHSENRFLPPEFMTLNGTAYIKFDTFGNEFFYQFNDNGKLVCIEKLIGKNKIVFFINDDGTIDSIRNGK